jgi:tRNA(Phe) wybutosine-synthesizing methylase Tyw3
VANFEDIGKRIDQELERLRIFVDQELKPTTQKKTSAALRKASERLAKLADEIESRLAEKK